jgi:acyl-CoA reductase-like NAD-dependent aldehyde dehydrogenase
MKTDHIINGESTASISSFNKLNPFNSEILYTVSSASAIDVVKSIQFAQKAFIEWQQTTLDQRLQYLIQIQNQYVSFKDAIIRSESLDQGLSIFFTEAANYNVGLNILNRQISELKSKINSPSPDLLYSSIGVVSVILSWNLSNRIFIERAIAAIMAGNTIIVKCSSLAPSTALVWSQIFKTMNLPNGVVQFLHGSDQTFKDLLVTHPGIKGVVFTGNLKNGSDILKKVSQLSHNQFKKIQISAGAKNPAIAISEPTVSSAADILDSFILGQGQLAWNSARLFILQKHAALWNELLLSYLDGLSPSEGIEDTSKWGPILKPHSIQEFNQIQSLAKADQAKLIFSNRIVTISEQFLRATFTKDMSNCSTLQQDQVLAPLYILSEIKYPFDIPKYSNVSYYGFGASLWSEPQKSDKLIQDLDVGQISLNKWFIYSDPDMQAVKQSAFGPQDQRIFGDFYSNAKKLSK